MFIVGTLAFGAASLLCGLAQTSGELVAARLLQGLTGAAMVPQVLALISAVFPPAERSRALSWFGVTVGVGGVAGQVLGGVLLQANVLGLGWRVIFLVNVPIAPAAAVLAHRLLPRLRSAARPRLDPVGAAGICLSLALVLVPLVLGRAEGWPLWGRSSSRLWEPAAVQPAAYASALATVVVVDLLLVALAMIGSLLLPRPARKQPA
ncbi:MFS transporter [Streptosporangium sp. CA-135522]|uniref:MFS transporter n=1 Tax=Streptosporangium sp. CA-135522 TaxID=3240072 RepID=UPI003D90BABC